jgi:release factor glutamine methyltransferase
VSELAQTAAAFTVAHLLDEIAAALRVQPGLETEAREMVAALLDGPRSLTFTHRDAPVDEIVRARARRAVEKRLQGAPLAYAVGRASFRHHVLAVDERVLIPRPETELLVDLVLNALRDRAGGVAVDVGTGSGAIALALASEGRFDAVYATDVSSSALAVAKVNSDLVRDSLRSPVHLVHGSLLRPLTGVRARVIVSNPPYIAFDEAPALPASVRDWEPAAALFSGNGGLATTSALVRESITVLEKGGVLAIEVDARRASMVAELVVRERQFEDVRVCRDLTGRERFVLARKGGTGDDRG